MGWGKGEPNRWCGGSAGLAIPKCPRPIAADENRRSLESFRLFAVSELSLARTATEIGKPIPEPQEIILRYGARILSPLVWFDLVNIRSKIKD